MFFNSIFAIAGTTFSVPLSEKVSIKNDEILKLLTIDLLKKYIWEWEINILKDLINDSSGLNLWNVNVHKVEDVFTEDDIVHPSIKENL